MRRRNPARADARAGLDEALSNKSIQIKPQPIL
jgi:hypothetical protein